MELVFAGFNTLSHPRLELASGEYLLIFLEAHRFACTVKTKPIKHNFELIQLAKLCKRHLEDTLLQQALGHIARLLIGQVDVGHMSRLAGVGLIGEIASDAKAGMLQEVTIADVIEMNLDIGVLFKSRFFENTMH